METINDKISLYIDFMDGIGSYSSLPVPSDDDIDEQLWFSLCRLKYESEDFIELINKNK